MKFDGSNISDQKRLVRGEQLLLARSILRARDKRHHGNWRVLMMAGGAPKGEITAIKELMYQAHIVAVDNDASCLEAAIEAGADEVAHCDLTDWTTVNHGGCRSHGPASELGLVKFDVIDLDLCAGVNDTTRKILQVYRQLVSNGGVLMFTFSYGRDVVEMFTSLLTCGAASKWPHRREIPEVLAKRLDYLLPSTSWWRDLMSVMVYRGANMPMCSMLFQVNGPDRKPSTSFVQIEPGDFELAVVYPEAANLYDCPRERIEGLRRTFAALKASITRRLKP